MIDASKITVQDMEALASEIRAYKDKIFEMERAVSEEKQKLEALEVKSAQYLSELGLKSYKSVHGTLTIVDTWRVNNPQGDDAKAAFFDWLKDRGIFEAYATVNNNSLNALWKEEREAAIRQDPMAALNFQLPGIGDAKLYQKVRLTKA